MSIYGRRIKHTAIFAVILRPLPGVSQGLELLTILLTSPSSCHNDKIMIDVTVIMEYNSYMVTKITCQNYMSFGLATTFFSIQKLGIHKYFIKITRAFQKSAEPILGLFVLILNIFFMLIPNMAIKCLSI